MIGILAGMGPMSTAPFIDALMIAWRKKFNAIHDMDYPHVVIYSLPTPFYLDREIDHKELENSITQGLVKLESWGVKLIAMPCNTAHRYFDQLQAAIDTPLLNMIEVTLAKLSDNLGNITLFATQSTFESNVYQDGFKKVGVPFIFEIAWQDDVNELISAVKVGDDRLANTKVDDLIKKVKEKGIQSIIIGCTDITTVVNSASSRNGIVAIDSAACLIDTIISNCTS
ncbi:amino acid racemase [Francisella sp. 19X1-34]|uniref:aspartate/glutamate racemase family protein n=1 Tax=Francisella sp. 19X1-34 TaxID=3087177 RepID=UPI002E319E54|nr:amino acid racemase [Francisella sp. 19X1-34]MED7787875.1 amino acid racemase [Francisella sp. 19X1-34]